MHAPRLAQQQRKAQTRAQVFSILALPFAGAAAVLASPVAMDDVTAMAQQLRSDDQELLQGLLHTLQSRHAAGLVFTRLGSMLIALNPLRSLPQFPLEKSSLIRRRLQPLFA